LKVKRLKLKKALGEISALELRGRHLPYEITQCYLPCDASEHALTPASKLVWYSVYLPRRDGRLSWPGLPGSAPAGSRLVIL